MLGNKTLKVILIISGILIALVIIVAPIQLIIANKYIEQGNENLKKHFFKSAFLNYEKASALIPNDEKLKIQMGDIYSLKSNLGAAEKEYRKAVKINRNNPGVNFKLIKTLLLEKKLKEAEKIVEKLPSKVQENPEVQIQAARVYTNSGKIDDALNILNQNTKDEAKFYQAVFYIAKKDFPKAKNLLEEINPDSDYLKNYTSIVNSAFEKIASSENEIFKTVILAESLNEIDEPYLAEKLLKEALEKNPDYRDALIFLGYSKFLQKDPGKAKNYLEKAIEKDNVYGLTYYFLGKVLLGENNKEEAKNNFEKAIEFGYKNKESYKLLAETEKELKDFSKAEEHFKKALEFDQTDKELLLGIIEVLIEQKKFDEAEQFALKNEDNKSLGWVYLEKDDLEKSLDYLKKAQEEKPYSAFIALKLGELLKKQGKNSEAKEYFKKAVEYDLTGELAKLAEKNL